VASDETKDAAVAVQVTDQRQAEAAATGPPTDEETPGARDKFSLARLLDPADGPQILRQEWHVIVGALYDESQKILEDAKHAETELTRGQALKRVEAWLKRDEVKV